MERARQQTGAEGRKRAARPAAPVRQTADPLLVNLARYLARRAAERDYGQIRTEKDEDNHPQGGGSAP